MCLSYFSSGRNSISLKLESYAEHIIFMIRVAECRGESKFCSLLILYIEEQSFDLTEEMTNSWIFLCMSWNSLDQAVSFAISNKIVFSHKLKYSLQIAPKNVQKISLWWGSLLGVFTLPDKFALLNIHSKVKELDKHVCGEPGDLYHWQVEGWTNIGWEQNLTLPTSIESTHLICQSQFQVYSLPKLNYFDALRTCRQINGNQYYENMVFQEFLNLEQQRNKVIDFWVPYTDDKEEGVWRSIYNDSDVVNLTKYFTLGQPNGGNTSNILCGDVSYGLWDISAYLRNYYSFCKIDKSNPFLVLRGLCLESQVERFYTAGNNFGKFVWKGLGMAIIQYKDKWLLHILDSNVWAESDAKYESIVIGINKWTIHNDNCGDKLYSANLSLR